jgi:potassium-transporting ATPase KdpC subunit
MRIHLRQLIRQMRPAVVALAIATFVVGVAYPLVVTAAAQLAFPRAADGSLVRRDGVVVGSDLIGQPFTGDAYFHPRPSAAGAGYDGAGSSGSNLGPLNPDLLAAVADRVTEYRVVNGLSDDVAVPADAVTASGSGLDPHISPANARLQIERVAIARGLDPAVVAEMVADATDERQWLVLGEPGVNVLRLNLALDELTGAPRP